MKHTPTIFMLLIIVVFGTTMYLMLFEKPWLTYRNIPFPVEMSKVRAGDIIPMRVVRCSSANVKRTYRIGRSIVKVNEPGHAPALLPETVVAVDPGCMEVISSLNVVPLDTKPGRYFVVGIVEIQGTFREMLVEWHSQEFEVIK